MPCPAGVNIPAIFERYNQLRVYGLKDSVQQSYAEMGRWPGNSGLAADGCIQCGVCEKKCPQNIPIRKQLAEAHEALNLQTKPYDTTEISGQLGIEKLQQRDVAALYRFYSSLSGNIIRAHRPYSWWVSAKLLLDGPFERLSAGDEYAMVIGDQGGNIWGHGFVEGLGSKKPSFAVGVHQRLLGRGWGRKLAQALLKAAEDELELEQIDAKVLASNTAGVELCRSMGFQVTGEYLDKDDGLSYLQMQKTIARQ